MGIIQSYFYNKKLSSLHDALERCLRNREDGKAFVYKKYYGYLMAIIIRYVKQDVDAEELVNESFVRIFRKLESFNKDIDDENLEKSFRAWIGRIAANISIDFLRSKKQLYSVEDMAEGDMHTPSVQLDSRLEVNEILSLLEQLPEIQKTIFNLYEIEGYSHDEIAQMLNIPDSTSRTYLTRAKQKLRKLYLDYTGVVQEIR
ncbi:MULTISPECIES: RNA polymerase sigma factor [unclassified Sphingobacterium]|uniref:RNA polymerase sigma factor n=1 Tax=unclassified Sphingobacterium TaxID=2609468 RepID=UPI0025DC76EE|nr:MULTISPECIES: RNA polymerase sigma factor [unclassified Sphingobacterium]